MSNPQYSILITTKNRLQDLKVTLNHLSAYIKNNQVECLICDDGSTDGTSQYIKEHYPTILLIQHKTSKGLIGSRNELLNLTKAKFAITLDDDAHIISPNTLQIIEQYFNAQNQCAVMAFRIFWGKVLPDNLSHSQTNCRVKGFVGCGHVWRIEAWKSIPNYLDWFVFYGEEEFASYQLFKKNWEVHYTPDILVQHRVDVKSRKQQHDYQIRLRRSLRSGWYLYALFYPLPLIPKKFLYTLWIQLKMKVFKGDFKAFLAILQALVDVLCNLPRLIKQANRLSKNEFKRYLQLPDTRLYWNPKNNK